MVVDAEGGGGVALRVEVDDEDPLPELGERGGDVHRGRGLADPALLVGDHHDPGGVRTRRAAGRIRAPVAGQHDVLGGPRQRGRVVVERPASRRPGPRRCAP